MTGRTSNTISQKVADMLQKIIDPSGHISRSDFVKHVRKAAHFCEFALLGACLAAMKLLTKHPSVSMILFTSLAVAVTDEAIQMLSDRTDSVKDILIDFGGAVTGMVICMMIHVVAIRIQKKGRQRNEQAETNDNNRDET